MKNSRSGLLRLLMAFIAATCSLAVELNASQAQDETEASDDGSAARCQILCGGLFGNHEMALTTGTFAHAASLDLRVQFSGPFSSELHGNALHIFRDAEVGGELSLGSGLSVGKSVVLGALIEPGAATFIRSKSGVNIVFAPGGDGAVSTHSELRALGGLIVSPNGRWHGGSYSGNTALRENVIWTGQSTTGHNPTAFNAIISTDRVDSSSGRATSLWIVHDVDSSLKVGNATALQVSYNHSAPSGNKGSAAYVGIASTVNVIASDGGTAVAPGLARGGWSALNPVLQLGAAATNTGGGSGIEVDVGFAAEALDKIGILIDQLSIDRLHAARDDVGLALDAQSAATSKWSLGISFGRAGGYFPVSRDGSLLFGQGPSGGTFVVANGVDWHLGTFTQFSWNDGHIQMTGAGDLLVNSSRPLSNGATSGFLHLPHTAGPPTGTPLNATPACEWNTVSHTLNCYDGRAWYHMAGIVGAE